VHEASNFANGGVVTACFAVVRLRELFRDASSKQV
jgi:hypothetical protein